MTDQTYQKTIDWLLNQGISTILLCAILMFLGYGIIYLIPDHITQIQKGYEQNAATLSRSLESIAESHDRDREMFLRLLEIIRSQERMRATNNGPLSNGWEKSVRFVLCQTNSKQIPRTRFPTTISRSLFFQHGTESWRSHGSSISLPVFVPGVCEFGTTRPRNTVTRMTGPAPWPTIPNSAASVCTA